MIFELDTNGYYALAGPFCLLFLWLEHKQALARGQVAYHFADTVGNLSGGLGEVLLGLFLGPKLFALYEYGYDKLALVHWREGSLIPWILAFALADFCYYIYHRAGHRFALFWAVHSVHHQSEHFNASVALRHPWFSDFYSAPFYVLLPLAGVPAVHFFIAISIISFYSVSIHTPIWDRKSWFGLVTPRTHILHHAQNPRYIGRNLGAMFTWWDRLFGTHVEPAEEDPPKLGMRLGYRSHDGAWSQFLPFRDLLRVASKAPSWKEAFRVVFGPPGYLPPGVTLDRDPPARSEESIAAPVRRYVGWQFVLVIVGATSVLWPRDRVPFVVQVPAVAVLLFALFSLGGLLDGRPSSVFVERVRVFVTTLLVALLFAKFQFWMGSVAVCCWTLASFYSMQSLTLQPLREGNA